MERLTLEDMIKALKCISSQDAEGDCYMDNENLKHMEDDKYKRIVCETGENLRDYISGKEAVGCPYHQRTYGTCYEDGELYWLKDVAELLEELKSYKEAEEQDLLVRLPCKVGTVVYRIESRGWTKSSICGKSFSEDCEYCEEKKCDSHRKYEIYSQEMISRDWIFGNRNGFGRTIFLTREEAEKRLEEIENE